MRNVIFEFQGNEISLTYKEAKNLIDKIEDAMLPAELSGVYASEEFGDEHKDEEIKAPAHLDDLTRLNNLGIKSKKVGQ